MGYADTLFMNLDTTRIKELGWSAKYGLQEMFRRMITIMKEKKEESNG